jgi:hypothetical protein
MAEQFIAYRTSESLRVGRTPSGTPRVVLSRKQPQASNHSIDRLGGAHQKHTAGHREAMTGRLDKRRAHAMARCPKAYFR